MYVCMCVCVCVRVCVCVCVYVCVCWLLVGRQLLVGSIRISQSKTEGALLICTAGAAASDGKRACSEGIGLLLLLLLP